MAKMFSGGVARPPQSGMDPRMVIRDKVKSLIDAKKDGTLRNAASSLDPRQVLYGQVERAVEAKKSGKPIDTSSIDPRRIITDNVKRVIDAKRKRRSTIITGAGTPQTATDKLGG